MSAGRFKVGDGVSLSDASLKEYAELGAVAQQNVFATAFPNNELPFGGSGWVHGFSDGLLWHNIRTTPAKAFGTQINGGDNFTDSIAHASGKWGNDQQVTTTITFANSPGAGENVIEEAEILLRFSIDQGSAKGYECLWSVIQNAGAGRYMQVVRWDGGVGAFTQLAAATLTLASVGDTFYAEIVGTVITVKVNGTTKITYDTASDGIKYSQGAPGIGQYFKNDLILGTYAASDFGFSSWSVLAT